MTQNEIIALRCPSCGGSPSEPSREMSFGAEFRCNNCGVTSVMIIDKALVPLSTLMKQGEKVCTKCGRMEIREARFCQEGHALVQRCLHCQTEFSVHHHRCDFCGKLPSDDFVLECPICRKMEIIKNQPCGNCSSLFSEGDRQSKIYRGRVTRIVDFGAFVEIIPGVEGLLHISEIAEQRIKDVRDVLKEGQEINVKIIEKVGNKLKLSSKGL
jgi:RecJ-like exonuclease